jgi:hypothetical protein
MKTLHDDPAVQIQRRMAEDRQAFAADVDALLTEIRAFVDALPDDHFGRLTKYEAWCHLRRVVIDKFEQRNPLRTTQLWHLVREAEALLTHAASAMTVQEWLHSAEPYTRPEK